MLVENNKSGSPVPGLKPDELAKLQRKLQGGSIQERCAAALTLGLSFEPSYISILYQALLMEWDSNVLKGIRRAILLLKRQAPTRSIQISPGELAKLERKLQGGSTQERGNAALALGFSFRPEYIDILYQALLEERSPDVLNAIRKAILLLKRTANKTYNSASSSPVRIADFELSRQARFEMAKGDSLYALSIVITNVVRPLYHLGYRGLALNSPDEKELGHQIFEGVKNAFKHGNLGLYEKTIRIKAELLNETK